MSATGADCPEAKPVTIAVGADEARFGLKSAIAKHLLELGYQVADYGVHDRTPVLYADVALEVAQAVPAPARPMPGAMSPPLAMGALPVLGRQ